MALIDADFWAIRRKIGGIAGASQVMSSVTPPAYKKRVPYLRAKPTGSRSSTTRQREQRVRWAHITWAWRNLLTDQERADWNYRAEHDWRWRDEEEQYRHLNGFQFFCGSNGRALRAGLPLNTDAYEYYPFGEPLDTMDFTFLSSTSIRVTFYPDDWAFRGLLIYGRGPDSPGTHHVVPDVSYSRESVPSRWYYIGLGAIGSESPNDFTLPRAIPLGRKLAIIACLMVETGAIADDWLVEQHVRT